MQDIISIAIDGPAGAGKSTIAKTISARLGILYLDTGAMYRALALKALRLGINPNDRENVLPMLQNTDVIAENIDGTQHTYLDGEDVSGLIRTQEMGMAASDISAIPEVRIKLAEYQREIARRTSVVMDGREIGSYVLPDCPNKFYVTASVEERARRRLAELQAKGECRDKTLEQMAVELAERDRNDSTREFAPLRRMPDAILVDTTDLSIEESAEAVISRLK